MQVTRKFCVKQKAALSSVAENTSCSRGWLRLVIQSIFAVVTTATFILIVLMAVRTPPKPEPSVPSRCVVKKCAVVCTKTPYYGLYEEDIFVALAYAEKKCTSVNLELISPHFGNNTLPGNWLPSLRCNIHQLSIIGGNLNHLPSTAFMSQFTGSIKVLVLQDLHIRKWEANTLVGLSSLHTLNIMDSIIKEIQPDSLRAVDNTLETLSITQSGYWNPAKVTGYKGLEKLSVVNFSHNQFGSVLGKESFVGLEQCKILYLNSCGIYSIGAGAFDYLKSLQVLYLDFNSLVTVPPGLFASLVNIDPRPRISLQENSWYCDCDSYDLRQLVRKDLLLVEGICSYPKSINGKTFTELEDSCVKDVNGNETSLDNIQSRESIISNTQIVVDGICLNEKSQPTTRSLNLISPQFKRKCVLNTTIDLDVSALMNNDNLTKNKHWVKFNFFFTSPEVNALQLGTNENISNGLLWFQSECPYALYCIDFMPPLLRIYNIKTITQFTFCPITLSTGTIENDACVRYTIDEFKYGFEKSTNMLVLSMWSLTAFLCIGLGAIIVYGVIRMNPILLKGSKRILFVKHKTLDALVLPPKVPLRNDLINDTALDFQDKEIFTLCANDKLKLPKMDRMISIRSNKSGSPSYISALQPSDDQLAEWRITRHFNNDLTISSKSESTLPSNCGDTFYYSLDETDSTYESLK